MPRSRSLAVLALAFAAGIAPVACGASGGQPEADRPTTTTIMTEASRTTTTSYRRPTTTTSTPTTTTSTPTTITSTPTTTTTTTTDLSTTITPPSEPRGAYIDALTAELIDTDRPVLTEDQATCISGAYVDAIGLDRIQEAGITPKDFADAEGSGFGDRLVLTPDTANEVYDQFAGCGIDLAEVVKRMAGEGGLTPTQSDCIDQIVTDENLRNAFVADFVGRSLPDDPLDQVEGCMAPD